jgi:NADPH-dependent 2,4-dienoyl-CoA reductase/sulfur reductase-like enzyme/rhodanese-related sulfurtransferase
MKVVIVGGVAGGATAAARLRRLDEKIEIIIIERGEHVSFANCGLPYHIGNIIKERDQLLLETPETFKNKLNIDVRTKNEVIEINKIDKKIKVQNLNNKNIYFENYDYLILSPGAKPIKPRIEGIQSEGVFVLRNVEDMDNIKEYIKNRERILVVGGGFIGIEMAENLLHIGKSVEIVEMADQLMTPVDYEIASIIHNHCNDKGLKLNLSNAVTKIEKENNFLKVLFSNGESKNFDVIIMSTGVIPEKELALNCGLELGNTGIKVNEYMQTSCESIYAVGDAVEINNLISGQKNLIPLAGPANKQARIAANNIYYGNKEKYKGALGTSIAKIFDMTIASTGLNEKRLKAMKIDYISSITNSKSHAGYYPGASLITLKILFNRDGKIFGAQAVGEDGVDKRIDVISTAIKAGLKVWDLEELELTYAPPFGSAKDPVNYAGFVANNIIKGDIEVIDWNKIKEIENHIILDVRNKDEINDNNIIKEGSFINIPLSELRKNLNMLEKDKTYITYCTMGLRGYIAYRILKLNGYKVYNLNGGFRVYSNAKKSKKMHK